MSTTLPTTPVPTILVTFPTLSSFGVQPIGPDPFESFEAIGLMEIAKVYLGIKPSTDWTLEKIGMNGISLFQESE